ncbi:MAG: endolytic transglycosylase MltG [Defluviitaleaceae bacterium]|nr:endolytic transglycosylase MltG [Defluviitaleaceae bacterium]
MANPRSDRSRMIFGVGLGIAITVVVVFFAYIVQRNAHFMAFEEENYYLYTLLMQARDDEVVIARAEELGMVFASNDELYRPTDEVVEYEHDEPYYDNDEDEHAFEQHQTQEPATDFVWVTIPHGAMGNYIAVILQHHGVVDDASAFVDFLIAGEYSVSLMAGNFLLPVGGDFNDILQIIYIGN